MYLRHCVSMFAKDEQRERDRLIDYKRIINILPIFANTILYYQHHICYTRRSIRILGTFQMQPNCSISSMQSLMTSDPRCLRHSGMGFRINLYREPGWDSWSYMSSLSNTWTIRNANTNKISFKQDESTNLFIGMQRCTPILSHRAYEYLWITTTRMLPQFHIPSCPRWLLMVSKIRCSLSNLTMVDLHSASSRCFNIVKRTYSISNDWYQMACAAFEEAINLSMSHSPTWKRITLQPLKGWRKAFCWSQHLKPPRMRSMTQRQRPRALYGQEACSPSHSRSAERLGWSP